jgi:hypothetical protein
VSGEKHDAGKQRWDLLPVLVLQGVVAVLTFGAAKYAPHNWQLVADPIARYRAALERHWFALVEGETVDEESGIHHAFHFACNALFLAWFAIVKPNDMRLFARAHGLVEDDE